MKRITIKPQRLSLLLAFLVVFGTGYWTGRSGFILEKQSNRPIPVIQQEQGKPESVDFSLFWDAWKVVEEKYVKQPDNQERLYGAIGGMVAGLGDPFSVYMKPSETARFNDDIRGNFEGIGAELTQKDGLTTVVAPLEGTPAERAGLLAGDVIVKINGEDTPSSLEDAVRLIRGKKGTEVNLTIVRNGKQLDVRIIRDNVEIKSVTYTNRDGIGVVKINQFTDNTTELLDQALGSAKNDGVRAMIVDLRNNPGGLLNVSVEVTSRFIEPGVVVVERDKDRKETELRSEPVSSRITFPLVVLVNKGSASASEIVAGAIQDTGRARIVGETTFGKGSVQSIEPLKDGSAIRITIAEWLTPKRREINKVGIKPDVEVKTTEEDTQANRDPQLEKALELVRSIAIP